MKSILSILTAAILFMLPLNLAQAQTQYTSQSGVSFFSSQPATGTLVTGQVRLPSFSGTGNLTITESGITGSPSGCTITLKYQGNNVQTAGAVVSSTAFTPSTGVQVFAITPTSPTGDGYVATYSCSSTYPTAGLISASFSPVNTVSADPCFTSPKSSVAVAITTATTTQLVALSATKAIYVCGFYASTGLSDTLKFEYGTSTNCTGTNALTGTFTSDAAVVGNLVIAGEGTKFVAPAGNGLCIVSVGTGGIQGVLTFIQQ
jgi:hypothetical protein